jgi:hypothetical protein
VAGEENLVIEMDKTARIAFAKTLQSCSDEDLFALSNDIITKAHAPAYDVQSAIDDQMWQETQRKSFTQQPEQPPKSERDALLVNVGYLKEWTGMLADEIGTCTGELERELRIDIKDQIKAATESLLARVEKLETELALTRALARGDIKDITPYAKSA